MPYPRDPVVEPVAIEGLRPTQMTVGMREVDDKRKRFRGHKPKKIGKYLGGHMIPVVWGPKERYYIIDHHHLALALHKEGMEHVLVTVISDLRQLELDAFWVFLDHHGWVYPYDVNGRRRDFSDGGFAKDTTPFSEFLWADFLRQRLKTKVVQRDFEAALEKGLRLAKSTESQYLPGWCGPLSET
jgi:hypothetical protein